MCGTKPFREPRVLAVEDGSFTSPSGQRMVKAPLIGVLTFGTFIDQVLMSVIEVDGFDVTDRIIEMGEKVVQSMDVVLLHGLPYGGFNIVDTTRLHHVLKHPIVAVIGVKPDKAAVRAALESHFQDWEKRMALIEHAGPPMRLELPGGFEVSFEVAGMKSEDAADLIRKITVFGKIPEPLRTAKIIADALSL